MNIYQLLESCPTLTALGTVKQIYPVLLPPGAIEPQVPAVVFRIQSRQPEARTLESKYVVRMLVVFDVFTFGTDYDTGDAIRSALIKDIEGLPGSIIGDTWIQDAVIKDAADGYAQEANLMRLMLLAEFMF